MGKIHILFVKKQIMLTTLIGRHDANQALLIILFLAAGGTSSPGGHEVCQYSVWS